jgi:FG-GAP-like repeat
VWRSISICSLLLGLAGCTGPKAVPCGNGWCPPGAICSFGEVCRGLSDCGNGKLEQGELCDDGEANRDMPGARCRTDCTLARCGDHIRDSDPVDRSPEECDDGDDNSDVDPDRCREDCRRRRCGDGVVDNGEEQACFESARPLPLAPVGASPVVRSGDLDGDGLLDLVVGQTRQGKLSVYFGRPEGGYVATAVPVSGVFLATTLGDFDGDGDLDLAVMEEAPEGITPFRLDGRSFVACDHIAPPPFVPERLVGAGDMNDDGMDELVLVGSRGLLPEGGVIDVLQASGRCGFTRRPLLDFNGRAGAAATARLDADKRADLVVVDMVGQELDRFVARAGTSDVVLDQVTSARADFPLEMAPKLGNLVLGDFDGDGRTDLAVPQPDQFLYAYGRDAGGFGEQRIGDTDDFVSVLAGGDFDGDGRTDLIMSNPSGWLRPLFFDAVGQLGIGPKADFTEAAGASDAELVELNVGDFDHDGFLDVVGATASGFVQLRGGEGLFTPRPLRIPALALEVEVALGDFNGDGKLDVAGGGERLAWYENRLPLGFEAHDLGPIPVGDLMAGDLDGDASTATTLIGYDGSRGDLVTWRRDSAGALLEIGHVPAPMSGNPRVVDLDGDHRDEVVVVEPTTVTVFSGQPDGMLSLEKITFLPLPAGISDFDFGDVDDDGLVDLVVIANQLLVFRGLSEGGFALAPVVLSAVPYTAVRVGHFDADQWLDFCVLDKDVVGVEILRGHGLEPAEGGQTVAVPEIPRLFLVGDVDGNGRTDVIIGGSQTATLVMQARRDGSLGRAVRLPAQETKRGVVGDLNGDGRGDLIFRHDDDLEIVLTRPQSK